MGKLGALGAKGHMCEGNHPIQASSEYFNIFIINVNAAMFFSYSANYSIILVDAGSPVLLLHFRRSFAYQHVIGIITRI